MLHMLTPNEQERLEVLHAYGVLDTPPEPAIDRLVQLAADIFDVPTALVALVDAHRQFIKAQVGMPVCPTSREGSLCEQAMLGEEPLVVPDAQLDPRFARHPAVLGPTRVRFYAGAPLRSPEGFALGTLCVFDTQPRKRLKPRKTAILAGLARLVMDQFEQSRRAAAGEIARNRLQSIASTSPDAIVTADARNVIVTWNAAAERMFGFDVEEAVGMTLDRIVPPAAREAHRAGLSRVAAGGTPRLIGRQATLSARRRDGTEFPVELSLSRWTENGEPRFGAIIRDATERQETEERLRVAATTDPLTGLANRAFIKSRLEELCGDGRRATVLLVDLDGFKEVNDSLGHPAGDLVLAEVAARLRRVAGEDRFVGRLGGDEFVVLVEDASDPIAGQGLGRAIIDAVEVAIGVEGSLVSISASIGIACSGAMSNSDAETLLSEADLALYKAKGDGRGRTRLFTRDLRSALVAKGLARAELAAAWESRAFELFYQPQVGMSEAILTGAEALIRWNHPTRGLLSPGDFLPLLESDATAPAVGRWIIETTCRQAAAWRREIHPDFRVAANLFALQFKTGDLPDIVAEALALCGLPASGLELEITENTILQSDERILGQLRRLREMGVEIAFDDFGTGFASLSMLREYPVSRIKIDRSFVSGDKVGLRDRAITQALIRMAEGLNLNVIAEGIETPEHHRIMREQGCDDGQGYLYGRPMRAADFLAGHRQILNRACA